jgi:hypothetical protein
LHPATPARTAAARVSATGVATFQVGGHRQIDGTRDASHHGEHFVAPEDLAIGDAERGGDGPARRRDRAYAGHGGDRARAGHAPDVDEDQRIPGRCGERSKSAPLAGAPSPADKLAPGTAEFTIAEMVEEIARRVPT